MVSTYTSQRSSRFLVANREGKDREKEATETTINSHKTQKHIQHTAHTRSVVVTIARPDQRVQHANAR